MLFDELSQLVRAAKEKGARTGYILNSLREYLQNIILDYIYNDKHFNQLLVFTGGTCLRFCYDLPRLSEDLDFDCGKTPGKDKLAASIKNYFRVSLAFEKVDFSIKGKDDTIYLKFNILDDLGLSYKGSKVLYIKLDIDTLPEGTGEEETTAINKFGKYYYLKSYPLPVLMSGKLHAFLTRVFFKGKKNEVSFKGRDLFDLVWFMGKNIRPDPARLSQVFKGTDYEGLSVNAILAAARDKVPRLKKEHVRMDLVNFIERPEMIDSFLKNYPAVIDAYMKRF